MLHSPGGRKIDAYIFVSAYQESEKGAHHSVEAALDVSESLWRERELVIFPSQRGGPEYASDISQMIDAAHKGGFDAICATLIMTGKDDRKTFEPVWAMNWDERWTLLNPKTTDDKWKEQVEAIGRDLWTWICCALAP